MIQLQSGKKTIYDTQKLIVLSLENDYKSSLPETRSTFQNEHVSLS